MILKASDISDAFFYLTVVRRTSWDRETKFISDLDSVLLNAIAPNFVQIREALLGAYKAILASWPGDKDALYAVLSSRSDDLKADKSFQQFWEVFGD